MRRDRAPRSRRSGRPPPGGSAGQGRGTSARVAAQAGSSHGPRCGRIVSEDVDDLVRGVGDLPVGEAEDPEARGGVLLVAARGPGLLGRGAVVAQAIGLDDEAVVGEPEVDFVAQDPVFGQRQGEARRRRPEAGRGPRGRSRRGGTCGGRASCAGSSRPACRRSRRGPAERLRVDEVELVRLVDGPLEPEDLQFGGEVDQRLHREGDRDPEPDDQGLARVGRAGCGP